MSSRRKHPIVYKFAGERMGFRSVTEENTYVTVYYHAPTEAAAEYFMEKSLPAKGVWHGLVVDVSISQMTLFREDLYDTGDEIETLQAYTSFHLGEVVDIV